MKVRLRAWMGQCPEGYSAIYCFDDSADIDLQGLICRDDLVQPDFNRKLQRASMEQDAERQCCKGSLLLHTLSAGGKAIDIPVPGC